MPSLFGRDDRRVGDQREVDARVRHQVRLELGQVDVQGALEAQRGRNGGDHLADQPVQVGVGRPLDVQLALAQLVDGLVVHHELGIRVLQRGVREEDRVVRLHYGRGYLRQDPTASDQDTVDNVSHCIAE